MMFDKSFKIVIEKKAQKFLQNLSEADYEKIVRNIKKLNSPEHQSLNIKKLRGYKRNLYRFRVDDYRIIFSLDHEQKLIAIAVIGHRKEIYEIVRRISF